MTENNENIIKIHLPSFIEMVNKMETLERENESLKEELTYFKAKSLGMTKRCRELSNENLEMKNELAETKLAIVLLGDD